MHAETKFLAIECLQEKLERHKSGLSPLTTAELVAIAKALEALDQPLIDVLIILLNRQLDFLEQTVDDEGDYRAISLFLQDFQREAEANLLTMMKSLRDGLALSTVVKEMI